MSTLHHLWIVGPLRRAPIGKARATDVPRDGAERVFVFCSARLKVQQSFLTLDSPLQRSREVDISGLVSLFCSPIRRSLPDLRKLNFVCDGPFTRLEDLVYYSWRGAERAGVFSEAYTPDNRQQDD